MHPDIIALAFEYAISENELNLMIVIGKCTIPLSVRISGVETAEQAKGIICRFFDTGELPEEGFPQEELPIA